MRILLQRVRGAMSTAAVWAVTFAVVGPILDPLLPGETGWAVPTLTRILWTALRWLITGGLGGLVFGVIIASDKRRRIEEFTAAHVAARGAVGAVLVPLSVAGVRSLLSDHGIFWGWPWLAQYGLTGALLSVSTFALAKRAARADRLQSSHEESRLGATGSG